MEIETYHVIFFYIVLPLLGIGIIIFALFGGRRLGQQPVEIKLSWIGVYLKSDALTLMIILGCVLACLGVFFWSKGYETYITELESGLQNLERELQNKEVEIAQLEKILERFEAYAMLFNLDFPREDAFNNAQDIKAQVYMAKKGVLPYKPYPSDTIFVEFSNDIWVKIDNLNPGDKLRIVAREGEQKYWQSTEIEIPEANTQMKRVK